MSVVAGPGAAVRAMQLISNPMTDAMTIQLSRSLISNAERLGLIWSLRPATTVGPLADGTPRVVIDGATTPISAMSLLGFLPADVRVMVLITPPAGIHVVGVIDWTTWYQPALQNSWTNRAGFQPLSFRRLATPPACVQVVGNMISGTVAGGILIATIPQYLWPKSEANIPCYGKTTSGYTPKLCINPTNGQVVMWDFEASYIGCYAIYPIDL
jgi:hypothetical protein